MEGGEEAGRRGLRLREGGGRRAWRVVVLRVWRRGEEGGSSEEEE